MKIKTILCALSTWLIMGSIWAASVSGQEPSRATSTARQPTQSLMEAKQSRPAVTDDLSISANVTARELRFEAVPNPKVEFPGNPRRDTVWNVDRRNLPRPVQPGVTYRNIGIELKITSVFADIDRIVSEALGEVSITNESVPQGSERGRPPETKPIHDAAAVIRDSRSPSENVSASKAATHQ